MARYAASPADRGFAALLDPVAWPVAAVVLAAAVTRSAPAIDAAGLSWIVGLTGLALLAAAGAATAVWVRDALVERDSPRLAIAAGWGTLTAAAAIAGLGAAAREAPSVGVLLAAAVGGGWLALGTVRYRGADTEAPPESRGHVRAVVVALHLVALEAGLAAALFAQAALEPIATPMALLAALALVLALTLVARGGASSSRAALSRAGMLGVGAGIAALAIARPGSLDAAPALLAVAVGALATMPRESRERFARRPTRERPARTPPVAAGDGSVVGGGDTSRLAGELRATKRALLEAQQMIERQRLEFERRGHVDPLTGLPNRAAILARLEQEVAQAHRYEHAVAVLVIDIDGFGAINRAHGVERADAALHELALRLRLRSRQADALGRLSGDSFLAILPHTGERGVTAFGEALLERIGGSPLVGGPSPLRVAVSAGAAALDDGQTEAPRALLERAQAALAAAVHDGGNRVVFGARS